MKSITREWYTDASHGWLKVKYSELEKLGIQCEISSFSYRNGDDVYLEEDCDALKYINAVNKDGGAVYFRSGHDAPRESPVRNFASYYFNMSMGKLIDGDSMDKQKETV